MLTGVKSNQTRESTKPQSSTKPFTTGQKIAVALAIIGALALVLGVLGQVQVGNLAEMGSDWNLGLMIGGGVMVVLQVGYLLIQMRKKPAASESAASGSGGSGGGAAPIIRPTTSEGPASASSLRPKSHVSRAASTVTSIDVFVRPETGSTITLTLDPRDTIQKVKEKFQAQQGMPAHLQIWFCAGKRLEDDKTLGFYQIVDGSTVRVQQSSTGGSSGSTASAGSAQALAAAPPPAPKSLSIMMPDGRQSTYEVQPDETVESIKKRLFGDESAASELGLYYNGMELREQSKTRGGYAPKKWTIADYTNGKVPKLEVMEKSKVTPTVPPINTPLKLEVATLQGDRYPLTVDAADTILQLKERLCAQDGIPPSRQSLIWGGKILENDRTIASYATNINEIDRIHMVIQASQSLK